MTTREEAGKFVAEMLSAVDDVDKVLRGRNSIVCYAALGWLIGSTIAVQDPSQEAFDEALGIVVKEARRSMAAVIKASNEPLQ